MKNIQPSKIKLNSLPKMKWRASGPMFIGVNSLASRSKPQAIRAEVIAAAPRPAKNEKPVCYNVSINSKETPMQKFQAAYESMALAEAAARKRGWDGGDYMLDHLDDHPRTSRTFNTKAEAEAWLVAEINAMKSLFGCGDIDVLEPPKRRCQYCTCQGWLTVQAFMVDDTGITEERTTSEECAWDEE